MNGDLAAVKEKGAAWLESQQHPEGWIEPRDELPLFAYKAPWAFSTAGRPAAAMRILDQVTSASLSALGDFYRRTPWGQAEGEYVYQSAWLACGAHRLGRYDIAGRAMDFLLSLQDPQSGGVYSRRDETGPNGIQEVWVSCMVGLAALFIGRLTEAERAGRFLERIRALQREYDRALYTVYTPAAGIVAQFPAEASAQYVLRAEAGLGDQWYFTPGLAAVFLVRLHLATGEAGWLELAEDFMTFAGRCPPEMYASPRSGKIGWGSALLYQATGRESHQARALRVAGYLKDSQLPDGRWTFSLAGWPERHAEVDLTAEFVALLDEMILGLNSRPGAATPRRPG